MGIRKVVPIEEYGKKASPKNSKSTLKKTHTEEIIISLIGQIGTNVGVVRDALLKTLQKDYNYECEVIKMSSLIQNQLEVFEEEFENEIERIRRCIVGGNKLRQIHGSAILSHLAVKEIAESRTREADENDVEKQSFKSRRKCYIIDSIKHPDELELLKIIYRDLLYTIGIFSPYDIRVKNLRGQRIVAADIHELIDIDSGEDKSFGQKVEAAFVDSDYFLNIESEEIGKVKPKVDRFLNLVFDTNIVTPSIAESAMFKANAAAMNSACLSRQVGAAITDIEGNILSLGWNDVPKAGGGLYLDSDKNDMRCYNKGCCSNDHRKGGVTETIVSNLIKEKIINKEQIDATKNIINRNGVKGLIEFSRSIHAEMHAIIKGAQRTGDKMIGGKLFCTTYPCHNCARHIILAGIKEVYYIEPYKKSLSIELHSDAICEGEGIDRDSRKVQIRMFEGVAPNRYTHFFRMRDNRKEKIINKNKDLSSINPKHTLTLRALHELESIIVRDLEGLIKE